jgi:PucR family transcriptional regulator, purine catabolism regulatory protein
VNTVLAVAEPPDPRALASLTVRDALSVPVVRRGLPQVLAGRDRLDRPIRWVHAGEVANIASLLVGGELLLTTGMGIGTRVAEQREFIGRLAMKRVAGLVIELGTVFDRIPEAIIAEAQEHDLPLVALSREIPFVAVTEAVHTQIVSSHYALLRRGEQIRRALCDLILEGGGIPEVLAALATTLQGPVFLEQPNGHLLAHAKPPGYDLEPLDVWEGLEAAIDNDTALAAAVRVCGRDGDGRLIVTDLHAANVPLARVALGHAADIVALALLRRRQEEELTLRKQASFLTDLADMRISPKMLKRAAAAAGLEPVRDELVPIVAEVATPLNAEVVEWTPVLQEVQRKLGAAGMRALVGRRDGTARVLVLVALRAGEARDAAADAVAATLRAVTDARLGAEGVTVVVGRTSQVESCAAEFRLTERSAASATVLAERAWHDSCTLELRSLLWNWRHDEDLEAFVERVLGPILEHDRDRKVALTPTLEALVTHGGHKAEAARALHLNRQALYQRLTRIEELLAADLSDPEVLLTLHVALHARRYMNRDAETVRRVLTST